MTLHPGQHVLSFCFQLQMRPSDVCICLIITIDTDATHLLPHLPQPQHKVRAQTISPHHETKLRNEKKSRRNAAASLPDVVLSAVTCGNKDVTDAKWAACDLPRTLVRLKNSRRMQPRSAFPFRNLR
jgi:hypothetical protein